MQKEPTIRIVLSSFSGSSRLGHLSKTAEKVSQLSESKGRSHKPPMKRTFVINIEGLDLNTPEGQNELIRRGQIEIATNQNLNTLDLQAFKILKESVKVKTDLNVWMQFNKMSEILDEWKEAQGKK